MEEDRGTVGLVIHFGLGFTYHSKPSVLIPCKDYNKAWTPDIGEVTCILCRDFIALNITHKPQYVGLPRFKRSNPSCHPDRDYYSKDLCKPCYFKAYHKNRALALELVLLKGD